jgi:predicted dehydrogenase
MAFNPPLRSRVAIVGTGHRASNMWGQQLLEGWRNEVEFVGLMDVNEKRAEAARHFMGTNAPIYTDLPRMLAEVKPDTVIVTSRDDTHDAVIIAALEAGARVITEKPMTTTPEKVKAILAAEKRTGGHIDVTFNYRFAPTARKIKELIEAGEIGEVVSVDFHWYLDTSHGADYFRRWHAYQAHSSSLFVHKATHHFDLLNWYLNSVPEQVFASGQLRHYGKNGTFRGEHCSTCPHTAKCPFYFDLRKDQLLYDLYETPSSEDGYHRDGCVFREDIDIYDTMVVALTFRNKVQVSYSLNACMPVEGHHLAFNGTKGRIEVRQYEKQPFPVEPGDTIMVAKNFQPAEFIKMPPTTGGHFGGDNLLRDLLFKQDVPDPYGQRAGALAGARSMLVGYAALQSSKENRPVRLDEFGIDEI